MHLLVLGFAAQQVTLVDAQCFGGVETYEKTSGTTVLCEGGCTSQGLLSQPDTSVTRDCIAICKQTSACSSFTVGKSVRLLSSDVALHHLMEIRDNWVSLTFINGNKQIRGRFT